MKRLYTKIPAMIAMAISIVSFALLIAAFVFAKNEMPPDMGISPSFALWIYAVIASVISVFIYVIDAALCVAKASEKIDPVFNGILAAVLIAAVPMVFFVGGGLGINILIWFTYYLAIFILEIVSIIKHIHLMRTAKSL